MSTPSRVVILAPNWLGDAVMALPALADVRRHWPDARLAVAARPGLAPLYHAVPGVEEVVALDARPARLSAGRDPKKLAALDGQIVLLLPNAFRAAYSAWRAGIRERWGYAADGRSALLTRAVRRPADERLHQGAYYQHLTTALGFPPGPLRPALAVPTGAREAARGLLHGAGWRGEPLVGFAPGAAYGSAKRWPPDRMGRVAARVAGELGARPVLVGADADRETAGEVVSAAGLSPGAVIDLTGRTDLLALMGVLESCCAFISNDSGAMHLAAALDVPVTAIFGPTREWATVPLPGPAGREAAIVIHEVSCRPCMLRTCPIDHRCMTGIAAEDVFAPVARVVRDRGAA